MNMRCVTSVVLLALSVLLTANARAQDGAIDLDIDGPVAKAVADPAQREALESECLAVIGSDAPWHERYRAAKILSVIGTQKSIAPLAALCNEETASGPDGAGGHALPEVDSLFGIPWRRRRAR